MEPRLDSPSYPTCPPIETGTSAATCPIYAAIGFMPSRTDYPPDPPESLAKAKPKVKEPSIKDKGPPPRISPKPSPPTPTITIPKVTPISSTDKTLPFGSSGLRQNCDFCVLKKVKCRGSPETQPCDRCVRNGVPCVFSGKSKPGPKGRKILEPGTNDTPRGPRTPSLGANATASWKATGAGGVDSDGLGAGEGPKAKKVTKDGGENRRSIPKMPSGVTRKKKRVSSKGQGQEPGASEARAQNSRSKPSSPRAKGAAVFQPSPRHVFHSPMAGTAMEDYDLQNGGGSGDGFASWEGYKGQVEETEHHFVFNSTASSCGVPLKDKIARQMYGRERVVFEFLNRQAEHHMVAGTEPPMWIKRLAQCPVNTLHRVGQLTVSVATQGAQLADLRKSMQRALKRGSSSSSSSASSRSGSGGSSRKLFKEGDRPAGKSESARGERYAMSERSEPSSVSSTNANSNSNSHVSPSKTVKKRVANPCTFPPCVARGSHVHHTMDACPMLQRHMNGVRPS